MMNESVRHSPIMMQPWFPYFVQCSTDPLIDAHCLCGRTDFMGGVSSLPVLASCRMCRCVVVIFLCADIMRLSRAIEECHAPGSITRVRQCRLSGVDWPQLLRRHMLLVTGICLLLFVDVAPLFLSDFGRHFDSENSLRWQTLL